MNSFKVKTISGLEKVFLEKPPNCNEIRKANILKNDNFSYQIAYSFQGFQREQDQYLKINIKSQLKDYITVKQVGLVPVELTKFIDNDDDFITDKSGLFPDPLYAIHRLGAYISINTWRSLWVEINTDEKINSGKYPVKIEFIGFDNKIIGVSEIEIQVMDCVLPNQDLIHTEWFYCDCIANYYNLEPFSNKHWSAIENFVETATKRGINMILTPIFTPPLDTEIGAERLTTQLVQVDFINNKYIFNFDLLEKWVKLCKTKGIKYFEISHLFTQWGSSACPKIMANIDGEYKKMFGWETSSTSDEYIRFLNEFLPSLTNELKTLGISENSYFHISDEPSMDNMKPYETCSGLISKHIQGFKTIDALSDYDFYEKGLVQIPIPATNHIEPFIENKVENLWAYYCCAQGNEVSNRFMAMSLSRLRILGVQLYLYNIKGFLHWGYNFYNSKFSREAINPYLTTDAKGAFPSGDSFVVYPGKNLTCVESLRLVVLQDCFNDVRALKLLERLTSKEYVYDIIHNGLDEQITFKKYPKDSEYILKLRYKINQEINKFTNV